MKIVVRTAGKEDCAEISNLTNQLGYPSPVEDVCQRMDQILAREGHQVFVAKKNQKIVGYIHLINSIRIGSEPFVEIVAFIVGAAFRGQGIGSLLITESEKWTTKLGINDIRIRSNVIRQDAHKLFSKKGFKNIKTQAVFLKHVPTADLF